MVAFGVGNGNPLQGSCPENTMDGGAWLVTVHDGTKRRDNLEIESHKLDQLIFHGCRGNSVQKNLF